MSTASNSMPIPLTEHYDPILRVSFLSHQEKLVTVFYRYYKGECSSLLSDHACELFRKTDLTARLLIDNRTQRGCHR